MSQHHDPVHPDSDHLSAELLADLDEDLLDQESATHANQHLAHCADCRDLHSQLRDVTASLAALPSTSMPLDVAARLLAEIAAQSPTPASNDSSVTSIADAPSRRTGALLGRSLGVAASIAVVLAIGGLMYGSLVDGGTNTATTDAGAPPPEAATGTGSDTIQLASYSATTSGTEYSTEALDQQVDQLIVGAGDSAATQQTEPVSTLAASPTPASPTPTSPTPTGSTPATDSVTPSNQPTLPTQDVSRAFKAAMTSAVVTSPIAAQQCIREYLQKEFAPFAIDLGTFNGRPAAVIVLPMTADPNRVEVWVIDPRCTGSDVVLHYAEFTLAP